MKDEIAPNYENLVKQRYEKMDRIVSRKNDTYENYAQKWEWWTHKDNLAFVYCIIGILYEPDKFYKRIPNYLRTTNKWMNFLQNGSDYKKQYINMTKFHLFKYLCSCPEPVFLELYNEFNQNMGNYNEITRNQWIKKHSDYLPKTLSGFNKGNVILNYNWRLTHQGHLSKYWRFLRNDISHRIRENFMSNRGDAGKSNHIELIMSREVLLELFKFIDVPYQILSLFIAQTGLRITDAINCLLNKWKDLRKFEYIDENGFKQVRYYIPNVYTQKKKRSIYIIFLTKEFTDFIQILSNRDPTEIEISILLHHPANCHQIIIQNEYIFSHESKSLISDGDILESLRMKSNELCITARDLNDELKIALESIRIMKEIQEGKIIRAHLLRKFFSTMTRRLHGTMDKNLLLYMEGHAPIDSMYIIYDQDIRNLMVCFKNFLNFLEPILSIDFTKYYISEKQRRLDYGIKRIIEAVQNHHEFFKSQSKISLLLFSIYLFKQGLELKYAELNQILNVLQRKNIIKQHGDYFFIPNL